MLLCTMGLRTERVKIHNTIQINLSLAVTCIHGLKLVSNQMPNAAEIDEIAGDRCSIDQIIEFGICLFCI